MLRREPSDFQWETAPGFTPRVVEVLASPARIIKGSPAKVVTAHHVSGADFYVKRYLHAAVAFRPLKFYFKASQAQQEWRLAQQLAALNVPIVRHLALGQCWSWRGLEESILVTEGFAGVPLDLASDIDPRSVLAFVGKLHDLGVLQRDLHPGNILAHSTTGELRLVDLHGIEVKPLLTIEERAANLAFLGMHIPLPVSEEIRRLSTRLRRPYLAQRAKRCLKHNREFAPQCAGRLRWQVRLPFVNDVARGVLAGPDEFLATRADILKPGRSSTVGRAEGLVLKRYNLRKFGNLLKDLFRPSKARRAFQKAYHLELAGVPTARPIATADRRVLGLLVRSYLLMEEIRGAKHLGQWRGDSQHAARATASLLAKLHNEGFQHRDLKETNLVFNEQGHLFLIDLEGLEFVGEVSASRAGRDLARLARAAQAMPQATRAVRMVFLHAYCKARGLRPANLRSA